MIKKTAIATLILMLLTCQFAYAQCQCEKLTQVMEKAQNQELTQEEAEKLFAELTISILSGEIEPAQGSLACIALLWCIWTTWYVAFGIYYLPCLILFAAYCT